MLGLDLKLTWPLISIKIKPLTGSRVMVIFVVQFSVVVSAKTREKVGREIAEWMGLVCRHWICIINIP